MQGRDNLRYNCKCSFLEVCRTKLVHIGLISLLIHRHPETSQCKPGIQPMPDTDSMTYWHCKARSCTCHTTHCGLQIYNETITDLLRPGATNLQLREDVTRGCFVDGLSEENILNGMLPAPHKPLLLPSQRIITRPPDCRSSQADSKPHSSIAAAPITGRYLHRGIGDYLLDQEDTPAAVALTIPMPTDVWSSLDLC